MRDVLSSILDTSREGLLDDWKNNTDSIDIVISRSKNSPLLIENDQERRSFCTRQCLSKCIHKISRVPAFAMQENRS